MTTAGQLTSSYDKQKPLIWLECDQIKPLVWLICDQLKPLVWLLNAQLLVEMNERIQVGSVALWS